MNSELKSIVLRGEAAVRSEVDTLAGELVELKKSKADLRDSGFDKLFQVILEACAYDGRGSLNYDACLKLLFPFLPRFQDPGSFERWPTLIAAVAARESINKGALKELFSNATVLPDPASARTGSSPAEPQRAAPLDPTSVATPEPAAAIATAPSTSSDEIGAPPAVGDIFDFDSWQSALHRWQSARRQTSQPRRGEWDVWVVRSALLHRHALPVELVDEFVGDDEFWKGDGAIAFAQSLPEPPSPEIVGRVAAALLNSRLRYIRPRLFLRSPNSPVIQAIGERTDVDAVEESLVEEISYPFLRSLRTIRSELDRRPGLAPRKGVLEELYGYLEQVLERMGVRLDGAESGSTHFDPVQHTSTGPVEIGQPVRVIQPGLSDRRTGRRIFKATVASIVLDDTGPPAGDQVELDQPNSATEGRP